MVLLEELIAVVPREETGGLASKTGGTESDVELDEVVPLGGEAAKAGLSCRYR